MNLEFRYKKAPNQTAGTRSLTDDLLDLGSDILCSPGMAQTKQFAHHGHISVYDHSLHVARCSLHISRRLRLHTDERALVRGALLHDYYLYDWHIQDGSHRWHGFIHAKRALRNAERDFSLNDIERDMIVTHMFPMNLRLPHYRESLILTVADKLCSIQEIINGAL